VASCRHQRVIERPRKRGFSFVSPARLGKDVRRVRIAISGNQQIVGWQPRLPQRPPEGLLLYARCKASFEDVQNPQTAGLALRRVWRKAGHGWPAAASQPWMADRAEEPCPAQGQAGWRSRLFTTNQVSLQMTPPRGSAASQRVASAFFFPRGSGAGRHYLLSAPGAPCAASPARGRVRRRFNEQPQKMNSSRVLKVLPLSGPRKSPLRLVLSQCETSSMIRASALRYQFTPTVVVSPSPPVGSREKSARS